MASAARSPRRRCRTRCRIRRRPDLRSPTALNQALLYRLSGDENPLPPIRARQVAGFDRPILRRGEFRHRGACRAAHLRGLPARSAASIGRGSQTSVPGNAIRRDVVDGSRVSFQCRAAGRGDIVLSNGLAMLRA
jgi:hypothetical protein